MKKTVVLSLSFLLILTACSTAQAPTNTGAKSDDTEKVADTTVPEQEPVEIVTSLFPLAEFAEEVGGNYVEVTLLLPPGMEPHSYDPKPSDIVKLSKADMFVYVGEAMEPWAHDMIEGIENDDLIVIEAMEYSELIEHKELEEDNEHEHGEGAEGTDHEDHEDMDEHHADEDDHDDHEDEHEHDHEHGGVDPHVWLNIDNDIEIVGVIAEELSDFDPDNAETYEENAVAYIELLVELDEKFEASLSDCKHDTFLTGGHAAYAYLAERYDLEYISAYGLAPDSEPTPRQLQFISDTLAEHEIKYVLFESLVSPRIAETLASEVGADTLVLQPIGNISKDDAKNGETFISLMEDNLISLSTALQCNE